MTMFMVIEKSTFGGFNCGLFSSKEKAENFINQRKMKWRFYVKEYEVDL